MASLEIDRVKKRFGAHEILKGIDIGVDAGEFLVLVGPSGCGKSTLLNMIAGVDTISEGEIRVAGARVNELHPSERDIAMVFQSYALYPNMRWSRTSASAWRCTRCRRLSGWPRCARWRRSCNSRSCSSAAPASSAFGTL